MTALANRLQAIKPSATLAVTQRAAELRAQGEDVISLSAGEPDFDTPRHIVDAAKEALDQGKTRYTAVAGIPELREAVAAESRKVRGVDCQPNQTIVTVGAKHAIYQFLEAMINPGDEVIIPSPYWVSYPDQVLLSGGKPVCVETQASNGFVLTGSELTRAITPRSKILILNTPSNPTGTVYPRDAVVELTRTALEAGLWILSDEIYRDLIYGQARHTSPLTVAPKEWRDRVFIVDGVSKTYAMTGWRIGWGIGNADVVKAMAKIQGQSTSNPTAMAQVAARTAVEGPREFLDEWRKAYRERRDAMVSTLNTIPGVQCGTPDGAFYVLPSVRGVLDRLGEDATDLTLAGFLLEQARIAVVPGTPFGAPGHIRLSYATSINNVEKALKRMKEALARI